MTEMDATLKAIKETDMDENPIRCMMDRLQEITGAGSRMRTRLAHVCCRLSGKKLRELLEETVFSGSHDGAML